MSKRPQATPIGEVTAGAGSFDRYYTTLDATGPLTDDKRLRYRLTAAYDHGGNHRKDYDQDSRFVSPYFSWDLTDRTQLGVELIAQHTRFDGRENPLPRHPLSFQLPVETNLGAGGEGADRRFVARIDLRHRFDNGWTLRQGIYHSDMSKTKDFSFQFLAVNANGVTGTRRVRVVPEEERDFSSQTELSGSFATGPLQHQVLAGVEVARRRFAFDFLVATATGVNLLDPLPGIQTGPLAFSGAPNGSGADTAALYLQDLIDPTHGFKLMLGVRFDDVEQFSRPKAGNPAPGNSISKSAASPRAGLIYQPTPATSIYGSWTQSFAPTLGMSATGSAFKPQEGEQVEFGVKHDLRPGLALTAALFDFKRTNVLTADPANIGFSVPVGEQRSTGLELEMQGSVTRDYSIVAAYTNLDPRVTRDNSLRVGERLAGVPKNAFALFNKLRLTALGAPAWSGTLGLVYSGDRESGLPNSTAAFTSDQLRLPAYTRVDAGLIYEHGRYTLRLAGTNLTNEKIYDSNGSSIYPRAPRAYSASLAVRF